MLKSFAFNTQMSAPATLHWCKTEVTQVFTYFFIFSWTEVNIAHKCQQANVLQNIFCKANEQ